MIRESLENAYTSAKAYLGLGGKQYSENSWKDPSISTTNATARQGALATLALAGAGLVLPGCASSLESAKITQNNSPAQTASFEAAKRKLGFAEQGLQSDGSVGLCMTKLDFEDVVVKVLDEAVLQVSDGQCSKSFTVTAGRKVKTKTDCKLINAKADTAKAFDDSGNVIGACARAYPPDAALPVPTAEASSVSDDDAQGGAEPPPSPENPTTRTPNEIMVAVRNLGKNLDGWRARAKAVLAGDDSTSCFDLNVEGSGICFNTRVEGFGHCFDLAVQSKGHMAEECKSEVNEINNTCRWEVSNAHAQCRGGE